MPDAVITGGARTAFGRLLGALADFTAADLGRIVIKVGVAYDSDPVQVREILLDIASAHPQIVQSPPPGVFLLEFGEGALEFELRCVVADVERRVCRQRHLREAEGAWVGVRSWPDDLEGRHHDMGHVDRNGTIAHIDINEGTGMARKPARLDGDGAAFNRPESAVGAGRHAAA